MTTNNLPPRFRKKPVVVEAVQFTQERLEAHLFDNDASALPPGLKVVASDYNPIHRKVWRFRAGVKTLEGFMEASIGDWIIKGVKGEFYPCKPDVFAETYEPADNQTAMPADAWQPIETAPEGTMLLLADMTATEARNWAYVGWLVGGKCYGTSRDTPTHWMPLPAIPGRRIEGES